MFEYVLVLNIVRKMRYSSSLLKQYKRRSKREYTRSSNRA